LNYERFIEVKDVTLENHSLMCERRGRVKGGAVPPGFSRAAWRHNLEALGVSKIDHPNKKVF